MTTSPAIGPRTSTTAASGRGADQPITAIHGLNLVAPSSSRVEELFQAMGMRPRRGEGRVWSWGPRGGFVQLFPGSTGALTLDHIELAIDAPDIDEALSDVVAKRGRLGRGKVFVATAWADVVAGRVDPSCVRPSTFLDGECPAVLSVDSPARVLYEVFYFCGRNADTRHRRLASLAIGCPRPAEETAFLEALGVPGSGPGPRISVSHGHEPGLVGATFVVDADDASTRALLEMPGLKVLAGEVSGIIEGVEWRVIR